MINVREQFDLKGKVAVVTGSAGGLGKEIALGLAYSGCSLVLSDIVSLTDTQEQIRSLGVQCLSVKADVSKETDVKHLMEEALSTYNTLDILINNAGISQLNYTPSEDLTAEEWDKIINVNLRGTFFCSKHVARTMKRCGGGSIINVASTAGINGVPRAPAYCASKAGIILLTKSLSLEWVKYNIRVNAIAPHYLDTELTKGLRASEKVYDSLTRQIPMRRFAEPREIVGAVLLLSSFGSSYMTGSVIVIDGGFLAQ